MAEKKEKRFIRKQLHAKLYKRENTLFGFPDFSFWTASIGRRIHENCIVMIPAADFPFDKFDAIIYQPADGGFA